MSLVLSTHTDMQKERKKKKNGKPKKIERIKERHSSTEKHTEKHTLNSTTSNSTNPLNLTISSGHTLHSLLMLQHSTTGNSTISPGHTH